MGVLEFELLCWAELIYGSTPDLLVIVDIGAVPLAYMPGNATRIRVKAAGELAQFKTHELV